MIWEEPYDCSQPLTNSKETLIKRILQLEKELEEAKAIQVQAKVKPACEFTDKQLDIISLAVEKWLIEDTFINYNGKHGAHFIDKRNGYPTLKDRLLELSKSV